MNDRSNRTVICSIAFLDIVDYSRRVGQEQLALKERFNALIAEVVKDIAPNDRVLIDTGDGAALCFMGDPEDALFVGMNLRDRLRTPENEAIGLTVRIGINLGPVRMIYDINNHQNVIGDGINVAQRVMSFAEPNQIMVSRTYFEVVSRLSQEFTRLFHYAGARTDKHVREHEIYEVGAGADEPPPTPRKPQATNERTNESPRATSGRTNESPRAASGRTNESPRAASGRTNESPRAVIGGFGGFVDTSLPRAATASAAPSAAKATARKRNNTLTMGAAAAAGLIAVGIAVFAGTQFKSDKANATAQTEAPAKAADQAAAPVVATVAAAKNEVDGKAPVSPAKNDLEAKVPVSAPMPHSAVAPKLAAVKEKAPEPKPASAPPAVVAAPPVKGDVPKAEPRTESLAKASVKDNLPKASSKDNVVKASSNGSGKLEFWIAPFGDVFIDGKRIGSSPPLKVYELQAGTYRVEIYNDSAGFPYKEMVEVTAGAIKRVNMTFRQ